MNSIYKTNIFERKSEKMTLQDYYKGLPSSISPKTEFINEVSSKTGKSHVTVSNWVHGKTRPNDPKDLVVLSELTGLSINDLFND